MYDMFFPKSCTVNSHCPDGQYCVLLSNEGLLPFYGYLHYFTPLDNVNAGHLGGNGIIKIIIKKYKYILIIINI
jgi:hypothetical protein